MEIDLYRDDGLVHVISTAASYVDKTLWGSTYFGLSRYDGRNWRGYHDTDSGLPSDFINFVLGRSRTSSYSGTDKGLAVLVDYETDTWVTYHRKSDDAKFWTADIMIGNELIKSVETNLDLPNHFVIALEFMGNDLWIGTGHGLARGIGTDYFPGLREQTTP
jgi:ligand-binding sensor domain-containing protein